MDPIATGRSTVRYVDIGSVDGSTHRLTDIPEIDSATAPSRCRQVLMAGDTVFSTVRPYLQKIAFIDRSLDQQFASTGFCVLRPSPDLDQRFLFHFAVSRGLLDQVLPKQKGVSYPAVLDREVRQCVLPVPPLAEQRRIVAILEEHLTSLDHARVQLATAERRLASLLQASMKANVGDGDQGWESSTVGSRAVLVEYGSSAKTSPESVDGIPVLRMGNIQNAALDWRSLKYLPRSHADFPRLLLRRGDLLFNRTNSAELVGKSAVVDTPDDASFASYLIRVRFDPSVLPEWANMVINSLQGRSYISSVVSQQVGQANVNGTKLKAFPLPVPPLDEQRRRVLEHGLVAETVRRTSDSLIRIKDRGEAVRRSLLAAAFSGRLTGRSSDSGLIEDLADQEAL
ncbi:MAG: restriction endonuclease subunit S [Propionicimonas sp.]